MWISGSGHWESHWRLQIQVTGVQGVHTVQVSLGGPLSSNSTKLDGKAPSHQPSSIWGGGMMQGHLVLPQGPLLTSDTLGSAR